MRPEKQLLLIRTYISYYTGFNHSSKVRCYIKTVCMLVSIMFAKTPLAYMSLWSWNSNEAIDACQSTWKRQAEQTDHYSVLESPTQLQNKQPTLLHRHLIIQDLVLDWAWVWQSFCFHLSRSNRLDEQEFSFVLKINQALISLCRISFL